MYNEKNIEKFAATGAPRPEPVEEVTLLSDLIGRLEMHNEQIFALTTHLNARADRLLGSEPPSEHRDPKGKARGASGGLTAILEDHILRQEEEIGNLESAIRRLSVL